MDKVQLNTIKAAGHEPPMWAIEDRRSVPRATFYNKDGVELVNLPADPYHLERFLRRGFTLTPPQVKQEVIDTPVIAAEKRVIRKKPSHKRKKEVN